MPPYDTSVSLVNYTPDAPHTLYGTVTVTLPASRMADIASALLGDSLEWRRNAENDRMAGRDHDAETAARIAETLRELSVGFLTVHGEVMR